MSREYVRLSYDIVGDAPCWPDTPKYRYEQVSSTDEGDDANFGILHVGSHFGTHVNAPYHFNPRGLRIAEVPLERFIYDHPVVIDLVKSDREAVTYADLAPLADTIDSADLLLMRTGWSAIRRFDPARYVLPLFVAEADSSPCTVIAERSEEQSVGEAVSPP